MALNIPGGLFQRGIFKNSPEDGEANLFFGDRFIPGIQAFVTTGFPTGNGSSQDGGDIAWVNTSNVEVSDDIFTTCELSATPADIIENEVHIRKSNGSSSTSNRSRGKLLPLTKEVRTYGGHSDVWGEKWTPADINSNNFGGQFGARVAGGSISGLLRGTIFNFNIPQDATIKGIELRVEFKRSFDTPSLASVDSMEIFVFYTIGV